MLVNFSSLLKTVTVSVSLEDIDPRTKKELFAALFKDLSFQEGLSKPVMKAINERFDRLP